MRRRTNLWYDAICDQLSAAAVPLAVDQIWQRMETSGFRHSSKMPRSTLGARIAELAKQKKIKRVGPGTYQMAPEEARPSS